METMVAFILAVLLIVFAVFMLIGFCCCIMDIILVTISTTYETFRDIKRDKKRRK